MYSINFSISIFIEQTILGFAMHVHKPFQHSGYRMCRKPSETQLRNIKSRQNASVIYTKTKQMACKNVSHYADV